MKKSIFLIALVATLGVGIHTASAQQNVIKVNFLSPVVSTASLFYERAISENNSVQLGFFYTGASVGDVKFRGFGITPEYRFYLSQKEAPAGFFVAPFARYQSFKLTSEETEFSEESTGTFSSIGGGLLIGGQWIFGKHFSLETFVGPSYNAGKVKAEGNSNEEDFDVSGAFSGFGIRAGATIGLAF